MGLTLGILVFHYLRLFFQINSTIRFLNGTAQMNRKTWIYGLKVSRVGMLYNAFEDKSHIWSKIVRFAIEICIEGTYWYRAWRTNVCRPKIFLSLETWTKQFQVTGMLWKSTIGVLFVYRTLLERHRMILNTRLAVSIDQSTQRTYSIWFSSLCVERYIYENRFYSFVFVDEML